METTGRVSPPNNIIHMLGGAGFLWLGWTGFNGGSPYAAGLITSLAILNTHICTATSLIVWLSLDMIFYKKSSVVGAVQGVITGLVCISPGAGLHLVILSFFNSFDGDLTPDLPWYTMMVLHEKSAFFQSVDDTLGVFNTHAVARLLGGVLSGLLAEPQLLELFYPERPRTVGLLYSFYGERARDGLRQMELQLAGSAFITVWNVVITSLICLFTRQFVSLRMNEDDLTVGDDAVHGEEATPLRLHVPPKISSLCRRQ